MGNGVRIWEERVGAFLALRRVLAGEDGRKEKRSKLTRTKEFRPKREKWEEDGRSGVQNGTEVKQEVQDMSEIKPIKPEGNTDSTLVRPFGRTQRKPKLASSIRDQKWFGGS